MTKYGLIWIILLFNVKFNLDIPDDDEGAEKWLEENEGIGGWWDDTRTNFHFNDDEGDFWIEEVDLLK